jgi:hypothetical protein
MALRFLNSGYFAGKVGIGTDDPLYQLQVQDRIHIEDITNSQPKISFSENTNDTGEFVLEYNGAGGGAGNYVSFYSEVSGWVGKGNGLNYIPQNGRVGIGTISPGYKLTIEGDVAVQDAQNLWLRGGRVGFENTTLDNAAYIYNIGATGSSKLNIADSLYVIEAGNVGIGVSSPVGKLQVSLPTYTNEDTNSQQAIFGVDSGYGVRIGYNETDNKGYINVLKPGVAWGSLILQEDVGKVGIGTVSPTRKLSIEGTAYLRDNLAITVTDPGTNLSKDSEIYLQSKGNQSGTVRSSQWHLQTESDSVWGNSGFSISKGYDGGSAAEYVRITSGGNVGINTTSPDFKLDVDGTFGVSDLPFNTDSVSVLVADETIGAETITNGDFATDADWTKSSNVSISGGQATFTANSAAQYIIQGSLWPANSLSGQKVKLTYTIVSNSLNAGDFRIGGYTGASAFTLNGLVTTVGTHNIILDVRTTAGDDNAIDLYITSAATSGALVIDNVSVKQVTSASNQIQKRELGTGAFGPTPVGAFLPLTAGSGDPLTGDLFFNGSGKISPNTADGSDNAQIEILGGGASGDNRGASVHVAGNEHGNGGLLQLRAGSGSVSQIRSYTNGSEKMRIDSSGNVMIGNTGASAKLDVRADTGYVFRTENASGNTFRIEASSGNIYTTGDLYIEDSDKIRLGASSDLQIYHDGSNNISFIKNSNAGGLRLQSDELIIFAANGTTARADFDIAVKLFYNDSKKFETTNTGVAVTGDINIDSALLSNQENTDIDSAATEVVAQVAHATYTAAFFDFVVKKGTNVRSGTVYACHNGDTTPLVEFTETSTNDLGDTSDVTLSVDISGTNMRLLATVTSDDWSVKSLIRAI